MMKPTSTTITSFALAIGLSLVGNHALAEEDKSKEKVNATLVKSVSSQSKKAKASKTDSVKLESVFVGDKEQPAISYFIPWQGIGTPDKLHWNVEQKHDGALDLVDRDIMLRSMHIYEEMNLEAPRQLD